jgi:hypothetical protein
MYRVISLTFALVVTTAVAVRAADKPVASTVAGPLSAAIVLAAKEAPPSLPTWAADRQERRPAALPALYGTYAALQALDFYSTRRAMGSGATEANPVMRSSGQARTIAIKAAAGASTIFFTERAWRKNRAGAIVLIAALNGVTAAVVARNAHNAVRR